MKKFILGFILGALVFSIIPISAAVQEYKLVKSNAKVIVDGEVMEKKDLPLLMARGGLYMPVDLFEVICGKLNIGYVFDGNQNEIHITAGGTKNEVRIETEAITKTPDGLAVEYLNGDKYDKVNGKPYVTTTQVKLKYYSTKGYIILSKKGIDRLVKVDKATKTEILILDNIDTTLLGGSRRMTYDYYVGTILPLIK